MGIGIIILSVLGSIAAISAISGYVSGSKEKTIWYTPAPGYWDGKRKEQSSSTGSNFLDMVQNKAKEGYVLGFDADSLFSHPSLLEVFQEDTDILISSSLVDDVQKKRKDASLGFKANHIWQLIQNSRKTNNKIKFPNAEK